MYVPKCDKTGKDLGFKPENSTDSRGVTHTYAKYDGKIPTWCPLQNDKSEEVEDLLIWAESRLYLFDTADEQNELERRLKELKTSTFVKNADKAKTLGAFLQMPNAYIISVDGYNIGHTAVVENVKDDNIHFVGVDEIVTFKHQTEVSENIYVFDTKSLIYIAKDNYDKTPYCQHAYTVETVGGEKVMVELGFVAALYNPTTTGK